MKKIYGILSICYKRVALLALLNALFFGSTVAQPTAGEFHAPLCDHTNIAIDGPHRFLNINGFCGFHPTSIKTRATIEPEIHKGETGTVSFWFSPLEDMNFYMNPKTGNPPAIAPCDFLFISDVPMNSNAADISYGIYWTALYPQLMGKFKSESVWKNLNYGLAPFVYAEAVPLLKGYWYHVALTWNKPQNRLKIFVNGILAGYNNQADDFDPVPEKLFVGNTMMVMKDLKFTTGILDENQLRHTYTAESPDGNEAADQDVKKNLLVMEKPDFNMQRDDTWEKVYSCSFTKPEDLDDWIFQTGDQFRNQFELRTTSEGLLIKTPQTIHKETRMYLWSPRTFEGDQWVEFDFKVLSEEGLALVVICASGYRREDFFQDYSIPKTGSMSFMLNNMRNYHWEYMRRVALGRMDVSTHYLAKNPWKYRMYYSCFPQLENDQWHKLRFIKMGHRLIGSIDDKIIFDMMDQPDINNGPVLNFGRIGLRQMFKTTMLYNNFVVYEKKTDSFNSSGTEFE
mgnify:FL=1